MTGDGQDILKTLRDIGDKLGATKDPKALSAQNDVLRKQVESDAKTIATLRENLKFYRENYRKAKEAYERLANK